MPLSKKALCGRNHPCPCGSTRKYKHCCLANFLLAEAKREFRAKNPDSDSAAIQRALFNEPDPATSFSPPDSRRAAPRLTDTGELPIRWLIANEAGTSFFADVQNRALVFTDRNVAYEIAGLHDFKDAAPGEINVAGVGPTKWVILQEKIPFVEVNKAEAILLVRERISKQQALLAATDDLPGVDHANCNE